MPGEIELYPHQCRMGRAAARMKLCVDCKWSNRANVSPECSCPQNGIDLVTGKVVKEYCTVSRLFGWLGCRLLFGGSCGKEGRWWEARDAG